MRDGPDLPCVELMLDWGDYPLVREVLRPGQRRALGPGARALVDSAGGVVLEREGEPTRAYVGPARVALGGLTLTIGRPSGAARRSAFGTRDAPVDAMLALTALAYFAVVASLALIQVPVLYAGEATRGPALSFRLFPILTGHARKLTFEIGDGYQPAAVPAPVSVRAGEQHMIFPESPSRERAADRRRGHSVPRTRADARPGGTGARARGWEGPIGNPKAPRAQGTWAVVRWYDHAGESLARKRRTPQFEFSAFPIGIEIMEFAGSWSPYTAETIGREQLAAPFGDRIASGYDWQDTVGNMFGPEPQDPRGSGLALAGVGPGGDGRGRGVGLGRSGPLGHGAGTAFDQGSGVADESRFTRDSSVGEHEPRTPSFGTRVASDVVERILARERARLEACVGRTAAVLSFTVAPDGAAREVRVTTGTAAQRACIDRVLSGIRFSAGTTSPTSVSVRLSAR